MGASTGIEWTDATWTPVRARHKVTGKIGWFCEHVSPGCINCYAEGINLRLGSGVRFRRQDRDQVEIFLDEKMVLLPLRWKKPRRIFVCSMTDLFADFVTDEMIGQVFALMARCPQHTFQVLTKRAQRMREFVERSNPYDRTTALAQLHAGDWNEAAAQLWPLPNVWLGVSAEDQVRADERIPPLLQTQAAKRFLSAEPLLGRLDLRCIAPTDSGYINALSSSTGPNLDWVIAGGESGREARPMHPDWARALRDQCQAAGVPFFFKQWGEWAPTPSSNKSSREMKVKERGACPAVLSPAGDVVRVGKTAAGAMLDGVEHREFPA